MARSTLFVVRSNEFCPKCGAELVTRSEKHGPFLECSQYPACDYARPLESSADGHIVKILEGQVCPTCGANLVLRQGRFGIFISCNSYPECGHTELINKSGETTTTYPRCRTGRLVQHCSHCGKTFHSCDRYPEYQFVVNFKPIAGECPECHHPPLIEKKTAQSVKHFCASRQCGEPILAE